MATRRLRAVPPPTERERPPDLRDAVKVAVSDMGWLSTSDQALAALALRIAAEIEKAVDRADELADLYREAGGDKDIYKRLDKLSAMCDVAKAVGWMGPQLQAALRDLGGTPAARKELTTKKQVGGRLAQIREDAAAGEDDDD